MINKYLTAIVMIMALTGSTHMVKAQGVAINTSGATADTSAMLDVTSTSKGVLVPRMLSSQRTIIATPATGLLVYQTDAPSGFYFYNGTSWVSLSTSATGTAGGDLTGTYPNPTIASTAGADVVTAINGSSSVVNASNLGTGSSITTKYLRGDNTWQTIAGGGTVTQVSMGSAGSSSTTLGIGGGQTLFTSSVSTSTTTPTISYSMTSAGARTVLTNSTGISGVPSFAPVSPLCLANNGGTPSSSTFYRGDGQWATPSSSSTGIEFYGTTSSTSLSTNALTQVVWSSATVNLGSQMNTSTGAFTASATGYYLVTMGGVINTTNSLFSALKVNGTLVAYGASMVQTSIFIGTGQTGLSHIVSLNGGDVLTAFVGANGSTTLQAGLTNTYLTVCRIQ